MAELQEIEVVVSADGTVKILVQGVVGQKCLTLTKDLERLLGDHVVERTLTDEYYRQSQDAEESVELELKMS